MAPTLVYALFSILLWRSNKLKVSKYSCIICTYKREQDLLSYQLFNVRTDADSMCYPIMCAYRRGQHVLSYHVRVQTRTACIILSCARTDADSMYYLIMCAYRRGQHVLSYHVRVQTRTACLIKNLQDERDTVMLLEDETEPATINTTELPVWKQAPRGDTSLYQGNLPPHVKQFLPQSAGKYLSQKYPQYSSFLWSPTSEYRLLLEFIFMVDKLLSVAYFYNI